MGIFKSTRNAICGVLDTVTDVADMAGETISVATTYVDNRSAVFADEDMATVATESAKRQAKLKRELEEDEDAAKIYKKLVKDMKKRKKARRNRHA